MRRALQGGVGRTPLSAAALIVGCGLVVYYWDYLKQFSDKPLDSLQKIAFVAAAFSVTTYNLRTRVIDFILKIESTSYHVSNLCDIAKKCGVKLTNLVILHTVTALAMASGGFVKDPSPLAPWYCGITVGLFSAAVIQFGYILFAFERLETYMLEGAEEKIRKKEIEELTKKTDSV